MTTPRVDAWRAGGALVEVGGRRLFLRTADGAGPQLLFLHGYPSSSYDWRLVLDMLPGQRTACFDFLGFGLSDKPRDHVYSLMDQADLVEGVVERLGASEVVLVAHDMGTSVATELLARDLEGRLPRWLKITWSTAVSRAASARAATSGSRPRSPLGAIASSSPRLAAR